MTALRSSLVLVALLATACGSLPTPSTKVAPSTYDTTIMRLDPYAYYHVAGDGRVEADLSGIHPGRWTYKSKKLSHVRLPNGTEVVRFAPGDYLTIPSSPGFSIPRTGRFTLIAWIDPDTLQFSAEQGTGYVNWLGKGVDGAQEWTLRMYSLVNSENRPNRISGYVFNADGGEGSGAYIQTPLIVDRWILIGFEVDTATSAKYPTGWAAIFANGAERGIEGLNQFGVIPQAGRAPVRIGTRDRESFFQGGIGDVAVFDRLIPAVDMRRLYAAMTRVRGSRSSGAESRPEAIWHFGPQSADGHATRMIGDG